MTCHAVLRSPSDLLAIVPYQLGFHPRDSLVVAALHGERLGVMQRLDIGEEASPGSETTPAPAELAAAAVLARESPDGVVLICYEERPGSSRALTRRMVARCLSAGMAVRDVYLVRDGRWARSQGSPDLSEPGQEGWARLPGPGEAPVVAEWIGLGVAPLPDRECLHDALVPVAGARDVARVLQQLRAHPAGPSRSDPVGAWRSVLGRTGRTPVHMLPARVVARAALGLERLDIRDAIIDWLTPGSLPASCALRRRAEVRRRLGPTPWAGSPLPARPSAGSPSRPLHGSSTAAETEPRGVEEILDTLERLKGFLRRLPEAEQAPGLCVLACCAWWRGDGALARIAAERAARIDPEYPLAGLLIRIIGRGIRWR